MKVGIDLGTTYSAVAYVNEDGKAEIIENSEDEHTTPSVVCFDDDDLELALVGKEAKKCSRAKADRTVQFAKRKIGSNYEYEIKDRKFRSETISSIILGKLKKDSEYYLKNIFGDDTEIDGVVITVPAYFNDANRFATKRAGEIAKLNVIGIINEPTAAAIAYSVENKIENQNVLVYDLGGGTFDVTILEIRNGTDLKVVATDGIRDKGGFNIDAMISDLVTDLYEETYPNLDFYEDANAVQELVLQSEDAKITLSKPNKKHVKIALTANGKPIEYDLRLDFFEQKIKNFVDETMDKVKVLMEESHYSWEKIDQVIMIGGSSKIPYIQREMSKISGKTIKMTINPDEAVAMGAAYYAEAKTKLREIENNQEVKNEQSSNPYIEPCGGLAPLFTINEVTSHGLGIICQNLQTEQMMNSIIVNKNCTIPAKGTRVYTTTKNNQTGIELIITEGEDEDIDYVRVISKTVVPIEPHPIGSPIQVTISLDEHQMAHIYVKDLVSNTSVCEIPLKRTNSMTEEEVVKQQNYLDELSIE